MKSLTRNKTRGQEKDFKGRQCLSVPAAVDSKSADYAQSLTVVTIPAIKITQQHGTIIPVKNCLENAKTSKKSLQGGYR